MAGLRTFDHDEARRLRAEGKTRQEICDIMGVTHGALQWIFDEGKMKNCTRVCYRLPKDMKRALERAAREDGRSVNSQVIKILQEALDWRYYEQDEDLEFIFAHPVARHVRRAA